MPIIELLDHEVTATARPEPVEVTTTRRRQHLVVFGIAVFLGLLAALVWVLARPQSVDGRMMLVDEDGGISLIDPATGVVSYRVDDAVPTPDRSALLTTRASGDDTVLESRDPSTGAITGTTTLDGELGVRSVSPRGGAVVLMPGPRGEGLYEPEPRLRTEFTIAYLDDREPVTHQLDGNIEPEMFSLDERTLFVLEFVPPTNPTEYLVRKIDVATGEISDTESPQVELNPKMSGKPRAQVLHPDGTFLFTLYTARDPSAPVDDPEAGGDPARYAFIHAINLAEEWSSCIFLPLPFGTGDEAAIGLAIAPDGDALQVVDASTQYMARIDTADLTVAEHGPVDTSATRGAAPSLAVARDGGLLVATGPRIVEVAADGFTPERSWIVDGPVTGLSLSSDGRELRIATRGEIVLLDRETGVENGVIRAPGDRTVGLLGPPKGAVTGFPLECAC